MSSKIFEEALADAKKLREVAEDNAKKAILESVTPRIRKFIEEQLLESDSDDSKSEQDKQDEEDKKSDEANLEEDVVLDEASIKSLLNMLGVKKQNALKNNTQHALKEAVKAAISNLNEAEKQKLINLSYKINNSVDNLSGNRINNKVNIYQENKKMSNRNFYEVDLQELRETLEKEMMAQDEDGHGLKEDEHDNKDEMYDMMDMDEGSYEGHHPVMMDELDYSEGHMGMMEKEDDEDANEAYLNELRLVLDLGDVEKEELNQDLLAFLEDDPEGEDEDDADLEVGGADLPPGFPGADEEDEEDEGEEAEEEANEVFHVDANMLREELARVRRIVRESSMEHHFGGKGGGRSGVRGAFGGTGKKNQGYKGSFGGGSYGEDCITNPPGSLKRLNEAIRKQRRQNRSLNEKLNKYRGAVQSLREQLEDLNLFNAKLLYVNKLLQNKTLSESQKKSVIKALDEARSLTETKSLYKSLVETFARGTTKDSLQESRKYASSSRTTTSSASRSRQSGELDRWQTLAGLKK